MPSRKSRVNIWNIYSFLFTVVIVVILFTGCGRHEEHQGLEI